jgi:hypothetical protein
MNREPESIADGPSADGRSADRSGGTGAGDGRLAAQFDAWLALTGQSPAPAGLVQLPMLSGSMSPALPCGSTLEIDPRDPRGFAPGEVVVLALDGRLVAHRVLLRLRWRGQVRLLEMGDANPRGAWRSAQLVVGRVVSATDSEGAPLPAPTSPGRARRGLLRHLRGLLRSASEPIDPAPSNRKPDDHD